MQLGHYMYGQRKKTIILKESVFDRLLRNEITIPASQCPNSPVLQCSQHVTIQPDFPVKSPFRKIDEKAH